MMPIVVLSNVPTLSVADLIWVGENTASVVCVVPASSSEPASSMFLKITPSYPSYIAAIVISCTPISQPSLTIPPLLQSISLVSLFLK